MKSETAKTVAAEINRQIGLLGPQCKLVTDKEAIGADNVYVCLRTATGNQFSLSEPLKGNIVTVRDQRAFARGAKRAVQEWLDMGPEFIFELIDDLLLEHGPILLKPEFTLIVLQGLLENTIPDAFSQGCFQGLRLKLEVKLGQVFHSVTDDEWGLMIYLPPTAIEEIYQVAEAAEIAQDPTQGTWRTRPSIFR